MKNTKLIAFLLLLGAVSLAGAQELPQVIPPSPTVANLMSFEEVPIDYYSGQPSISIPLFSKQISPSAGMSVSLAYNTQGIKIDSRSGWAGTGWSLNVGGSISRTVRGIPDEKQVGGQDNNKLGVFHNNDFWNYDNLTGAQKAEFAWRTKGSSFHQYDTELDLYQFSLLGVSGRFVIVKESGSLKAKLLNKDQNVKIDLSYDNTTYAISSFTITDAHGYQYFFDVEEITEAIPVSATQLQTQGSVVSINAGGASAVYNYTSAWHLTNVKTSNNVELASFTYAESEESFSVSRTVTQNRIVSVSGAVSLPDFLANPYNGSQLKPSQVVSYFSNTIDTQKPATVTFKDGTSISFQSVAGHPETGGEILHKLFVKDELGNVEKTFTFNTNVTSSNNRLWLNSVDETAGTVTLTHNIHYHDKANLPAWSSHSDSWGYNADMSTSGLPVAFNAETIKKGLIESIDFPTGGKKEFVFEHNSFSYGAGDTLTIDQYWENPDNYDLTVDTQNFNTSYDLGANGGDFYAHLFDVDFDQTVYLDIDLQGSGGGSVTDPFDGALQGPSEGSSGPVPFDPVNNMVLRIENSIGDLLMLIPMRNVAFTTSLPLPAGTNYSLILDSPTIGDWDLDGHLKVRYKSEKGSQTSKFLYGGGVRIKEVNFYQDAADLTSAERSWSYSYQDSVDTGRSSGAVDALLGNLANKYEVTTGRHLYEGRERVAPITQKTVRYEVSSQGPNAQLSKGGYVGYSRVTVQETGLGKTVMVYTNAADYPNSATVFTYPFTPAKNLDYKRGLLLKQSVYNESGQMLKETINTYGFDLLEESIATSKKFYNSDGCHWLQFYDAFVSHENMNPEEALIPKDESGYPVLFTYSNCGVPFQFIDDDIFTNWARLIETKQRDFTYVGGSPIMSQIRTTFEYNSFNYQQSETNRYVKENGAEVEYKTKMYYPIGGYPTGEYSVSEQIDIAKMRTMNNINTLVYQEDFRAGVAQNTVQNVFRQYHTQLVALQEVLTARGTDSPESRMIVHGYDNHGNILEVSKTNDSHIVYLWGYDQTVPVAQIQNATYAQIEALTGFGNDFHAGSAGLTAAQEATLRSLPNALVTTMTYDRIFGMLSQTGPNGITTYYEYDALGRLAFVKDQDGNILKMNEYAYQVNANSTGY